MTVLDIATDRRQMATKLDFPERVRWSRAKGVFIVKV